MVCELTIGKEKYKEVEEEMIEIKEKASKLKEEFLTLVEKDEEAFNQVMESFKLPKTTDEEKKERTIKIQSALQEATRVPLETMRKSKNVIELAHICAEKGNVNAISDAGVAVTQAKAAAQGALYNVHINLGSIKDGEFKNQAKEESDRLMKEIKDLGEKVEKLVISKL
jgi:formiminotetrahydrofolate cyclodeaminase